MGVYANLGEGGQLMPWQDIIFLVGSLLSVGFLIPTIRDKEACIPWATSIPSVVIGLAYACTFFTLGMTFSAFGAFAACAMWMLIVYLRGPNSSSIGELLAAILKLQPATSADDVSQ